MTRRDFIKAGTLLSASAIFFPNELFAYSRMPVDRTLNFYNTHTGERVKATYWAKDRFVYDELDNINWILRDFRTDDIVQIDIELLDLLYAMQLINDSNSDFHIISGYRSPKTNQMLQKRSRGVAKRSYHLDGQAIDIFLPGTQLKNLRKIALHLKRGGVGYYPKSNFIHVDTGPVRHW